MNIKQRYHGKLEGEQLDALTETLKRINWSAGYGDVAAVLQEAQMVRIERLHMSPTLRSYKLFTDAKRRLIVRFAGREQLVRKTDYTFRKVA